MTADKRNAVVVVALVLALTGGAGVLLCLEPTKPAWPHPTLLAAESEAKVREVEIHYAPSVEQANTLIAQSGADSLCVVLENGDRQWDPGGDRVQLIVVGCDGDTLAREQKRIVLEVLGNLSTSSSSGQVHVYLDPESDARRTADLPPQATDLLNLLERKRIID